MYKIYLLLTTGEKGYFDSAVGRYIFVRPNEWEAASFPTFESALSKARWLKRNYFQVGYYEVM